MPDSLPWLTNFPMTESCQLSCRVCLTSHSFLVCCHVMTFPFQAPSRRALWFLSPNPLQLPQSWGAFLQNFVVRSEDFVRPGAHAPWPTRYQLLLPPGDPRATLWEDPTIPTTLRELLQWGDFYLSTWAERELGFGVLLLRGTLMVCILPLQLRLVPVTEVSDPHQWGPVCEGRQFLVLRAKLSSACGLLRWQAPGFSIFTVTHIVQDTWRAQASQERSGGVPHHGAKHPPTHLPWKPQTEARCLFCCQPAQHRIWIHNFFIALRHVLRWGTTFIPSRELAASFWVGGAKENPSVWCTGIPACPSGKDVPR